MSFSGLVPGKMGTHPLYARRGSLLSLATLRAGPPPCLPLPQQVGWRRTRLSWRRQLKNWKKYWYTIPEFQSSKKMD